MLMLKLNINQRYLLNNDIEIPMIFVVCLNPSKADLNKATHRMSQTSFVCFETAPPPQTSTVSEVDSSVAVCLMLVSMVSVKMDCLLWRHGTYQSTSRLVCCVVL